MKSTERKFKRRKEKLLMSSIKFMAFLISSKKHEKYSNFKAITSSRLCDEETFPVPHFYARAFSKNVSKAKGESKED